MYVLTYIFIVNRNSYETITKVLSDWSYGQAGARGQTVIPYRFFTCTPRHRTPGRCAPHLSWPLRAVSGGGAKTFGKRDNPDFLEYPVNGLYVLYPSVTNRAIGDQGIL